MLTVQTILQYIFFSATPIQKLQKQKRLQKIEPSLAGHNHGAGKTVEILLFLLICSRLRPIHYD